MDKCYCFCSDCGNSAPLVWRFFIAVVAPCEIFMMFGGSGFLRSASHSARWSR